MVLIFIIPSPYYLHKSKVGPLKLSYITYHGVNLGIIWLFLKSTFKKYYLVI